MPSDCFLDTLNRIWSKMPSPSELSRTLFGIQRYGSEENFTNWTNYTPDLVVGSGSLTDTTIDYATYITVNPFTYFNVSVTIDDVGTAADFLWISIPITIFNDNNSVQTGVLLSGGVYTCLSVVLIPINNSVTILQYDGTTALATGNTILVSGYYRTAIQE